MDPACTVLKVFKGLQNVLSITQFVQYKSALPFRFKKRTESEAQALDTSMNLKDRLDLRETIHVTIDGELAKDFDDAVCIEKTDKGFILYVSIADVSRTMFLLGLPSTERRMRGVRASTFPVPWFPCCQKYFQTVFAA